MQKTLNLRVKYRESFRPFAPSVLREDLSDWFELAVDSPYMLLVADVAPGRRIAMTAAEQALFGIDRLNSRSAIPAVARDCSARADRPATRSTLSCAPVMIQDADHVGARQCIVQRARRADRRLARGCVPLLRERTSGCSLSALPAREGGAGPRAQKPV
jgi:hypothetical protein